MKKWKCTFWRYNPQLKNNGYEVVKVIEARTENSARNKAYKMEHCIYGSMMLRKVEPED